MMIKLRALLLALAACLLAQVASTQTYVLTVTIQSNPTNV